MIANSSKAGTAALVCVLWTNISTVSLAQGVSSRPRDDRERKAAAEVLFEAGKDLVRQGLVAEGCSKLEESQKLDAGIGTQFNLADCYERLGRLASAYALFMEVAAATHQRGQAEREAVARERAADLKPRLSRLVIVVDRTKAPPGIAVARNGTPVGVAQWGVAIPVDPGEVRVTVTAPDKRAWEILVNVRDEGQNARIEVPGLQPVPTQRMTADLLDTRAELPFWDQPKNWVGAGLTGLGVVGIGLFAYFGQESAADYRETQSECDDDDRCSSGALDQRLDAYRAGERANLSLAAGAGCLVAGSILMWLVPSGTSNVSATPLVGADVYGASVRGAF